MLQYVGIGTHNPSQWSMSFTSSAFLYIRQCAFGCPDIRKNSRPRRSNTLDHWLGISGSHRMRPIAGSKASKGSRIQTFGMKSKPKPSMGLEYADQLTSPNREIFHTSTWMVWENPCPSIQPSIKPNITKQMVHMLQLEDLGTSDDLPFYSAKLRGSEEVQGTFSNQQGLAHLFEVAWSIPPPVPRHSRLWGWRNDSEISWGTVQMQCSRMFSAW